MCLAAAGHLVEHDRLADLGITDPRLAALVTEAWHRRAELPSLCGRFDLRYDGSGPARLLSSPLIALIPPHPPSSVQSRKHST
ncbi:Glutathionylspermidine synthase [Streptomyces sp. YIM 121038]|nr:Glutathionylspermidine synthase [Streptomyces sp. YIM 121038]